MAKTLQEYADWLLEREDLRWPKPEAIEAPKATAYLRPLEGVRLVVWNIYGTLLRIADGELLFHSPEPMRMQIALEKMDAEFNMWNHMYRKPIAPWKYLEEQYLKFLERQCMAATKVKGDVPEVQSGEIWRQIFEQLEEKDYKYDEDLYGDKEGLFEKAAYFFHQSLQGLDAAPNALTAIQSISAAHLQQGLLADAQSFTLAQLLRCLKTQGNLPPWGDLFQSKWMILSYQLGVRKPSKTLYQTLLSRAKDSGIAAGEILYVSSRLDQDLAVARSLGILTALYAGDKLSLRATKEEIANPKLRPDRLLTDLAQVGELLQL